MAIAVLGMHRSGTSMVTRMLAHCGLQVGPSNELLGPTSENPTGRDLQSGVDLLGGLIVAQGVDLAQGPFPTDLSHALLDRGDRLVEPLEVLRLDARAVPDREVVSRHPVMLFPRPRGSPPGLATKSRELFPPTPPGAGASAGGPGVR